MIDPAATATRAEQGSPPRPEAGRMPAPFVRGGLAAGAAGYAVVAAADLFIGSPGLDEVLAMLGFATGLAISFRWLRAGAAVGLATGIVETIASFADYGVMTGSGLVLPVLVTVAGLFLGEVAALVTAAVGLVGSLGAALLVGPQSAGMTADERQRAVVLGVTVIVDAALTFVAVRAHRRALAASEDARHLVLRETAERHALEEQLRHAQRLETVGLLAGGVAHDFNNLLTAIGGNASLLAEKRDEETAALAGEILEAQRHGTALTRQLLAFARREVRRPGPLDLAAVARGTERLLARILAERNRLELRAEGEVPVVADLAQVEQVLVNLVTNARDASPPGAPIRVTARALAPGQAAAHGCTLAGDVAMLEVRDEGTGMSAETRERIFEPFFTTKPRGQGTGLGLSTVHGIVAQSGGHVAVESEVGRGTTFRVFLPIASPPAMEEPVRPSVPSARAAGQRVLLVEDDPTVRALVERVLSGAGYQVIGGGSGAEALAAAGPGARPGILLTDMAMPGMTGPEVARRARARWPGLPVVFMTGYFGGGGGGPAEGATLQKPFSPEELLVKVREAIAAAQPP